MNQMANLCDDAFVMGGAFGGGGGGGGYAMNNSNPFSNV